MKITNVRSGSSAGRSSRTSARKNRVRVAGATVRPRELIGCSVMPRVGGARRSSPPRSSLVSVALLRIALALERAQAPASNRQPAINGRVAGAGGLRDLAVAVAEGLQVQVAAFARLERAQFGHPLRVLEARESLLDARGLAQVASFAHIGTHGARRDLA